MQLPAQYILFMQCMDRLHAGAPCSSSGRYCLRASLPSTVSYVIGAGLTLQSRRQAAGTAG